MFTYRHVTDILEHSSHANKQSVVANDVKSAVPLRMDHSFTQIDTFVYYSQNMTSDRSVSDVHGN